MVERDVLTERVPDFVRSSRDAAECLCGACLLPIEEEKVGAIDNCTHLFHYECVEKWSQTENSCPQCKVRFFWMAGYGADQRLSLSKVESKDQEEQEEEEFEEISICERCKEAGDEAKLLLCDGMHGTCNATFHYTCVGLSAVPRGSWFCPDCLERGFDVDARGHRGGGRGVRSDVAAVTSVPRAETAVEATPPPRVAAVARPPAEHEQRLNGGASVETPERPDVNERRTPRARAALPSQLQLSALACLTPAVEVPAFQAASAPRAGLFATFAARRRQRQRESSEPNGFITLNPSYEDDFMANQKKAGG